MVLADEYQMLVIKERCENVLKGWLDAENSEYSSTISSTRQYKGAEVCLQVIEISNMINHGTLLEKSKSILSRFHFKAFTGVYFTTRYEQSSEDPVKHRESCAKIFGELPSDIQISILLGRLNTCDNC